MLKVYSIFTFILNFFAPLFFKYRILKKKDDPKRYLEKLGIYNKGSKKCAPKPPACPCNLPRQGDPDFGKCTPPPPGCGPAPQAQKCNVPGYGPRNLVCRCGKWQCPTAKDLLIEKFKAQGKAIPKGVAGYGDVTNKKPMIFLGILAAIVVGIFLFSK